MSLFKAYLGTSSQLPNRCYAGFMYLLTDTQKLIFDTEDTVVGDTSKRVQVKIDTSEFAEALKKGATTLQITDIVTKSDEIPITKGGTGRTDGTVASADEADKLSAGVNLKVDLSSTNGSAFDGSADVEDIGVDGILAVANGGTGNSTGKAPYAVAADTAEKLATPINIGLSGVTATNKAFDGSADIIIPISAIPTDLLTGKFPANRLDGVIPIENIPAGALERLIVVADEDARLALTKAQAQTGDTVKQNDTGEMFYIKDGDKLEDPDPSVVEEAFEVYTVGSATSVPWTGVTGKPDLYDQDEVEDLVEKKSVMASTQSWEITIPTTSWTLAAGGSADTGPYEYTHTMTGSQLTCGRTGRINPMIAPLPLDGEEEVDYKEWTKVTSAKADVDTNSIIFRCAKKAPEKDILVSVIDFGSPDPTA